MQLSKTTIIIIIVFVIFVIGVLVWVMSSIKQSTNALVSNLTEDATKNLPPEVAELINSKL